MLIESTPVAKRTSVKITAALNQPAWRKSTPESVFLKIPPPCSNPTARGPACSGAYAPWTSLPVSR
ncbi:hypothetical protein IFM47457_09576 [Aspergillus lentulus]|nr:hypothetical protein IFM47457_09576 [Aspergillus lentulus]